MQDVKALMARFYQEVVNEGRLEVIDELCAPEFVEHETVPGVPGGIEGVRWWFASLREAVPDVRATVWQTIVEGDLGVARVTISGTQQGPFMGMPATGRHFSMDVIDIVRLEGGRAVEHWGVSDLAGMMEQLGLLPAPVAEGEAG